MALVRGEGAHPTRGPHEGAERQGAKARAKQKARCPPPPATWAIAALIGSDGRSNLTGRPRPRSGLRPHGGPRLLLAPAPAPGTFDGFALFGWVGWGFFDLKDVVYGGRVACFGFGFWFDGCVFFELCWFWMGWFSMSGFIIFKWNEDISNVINNWNYLDFWKIFQITFIVGAVFLD